MDIYSNFVSDLNNKLRIKLVGEKNDDDLYSGWEINKISSDFNEIYYKSELLRTIEELIKSGTNPSDIWIVDKSIDINKKYIHYKTGKLSLSNPKDVKNLYYLGSPTPLYTNKKVMLLSLAFDAFRSVYTICNKHKIIIPSRTNTLSIILHDLNKGYLTNLTNYFQEIVFNTNNLKESKLKNTLSLEISSSLKEYDERFGMLLKENFEDNVSFPEKLTKYDQFNSIFNSYERPVVLVNNSSILNEKTTELSILCYEFLVNEKFKKSNPRFLETNLISQNSPLVYGVTLGITIIPYLISIHQKRKDLIAKKLENYEAQNGTDEEVNNLNIQIDELNQEINDLSNNGIENQFETHKQNNGVTEAQNDNNIVALDMIQGNKNVNSDKGVKWLNDNNLKFDSYEQIDIEG